ncbi:MAG TPA: M42 family peptidase [Euryarchaeota archaeon]|nr:M42 family peptidase [Euryarchaeota archaeon]
MEKNSISFLERLTNCFGPSGFEREPLLIVKEYVKPHVDKITTDKLGSLHFEKRGSADFPRVLLPGHVDEVGFVISGINKQGFLTFNPLGGWFDQILLGQRIRVRTNLGDVDGVIAAKPPHLLQEEERNKVFKKEQMFIDVGASNEDEAKAMGIRIGNPAVPISDFSTVSKKKYKDGKLSGKETICFGKAFDDRVGAFISAESVRIIATQKIKHPNTVIGAATVQEEVGLRGARTTGFVTQPDVCITLEVDISGDVPGIEPHQAPTRMGDGPGVTTYDGSMIPNQGLVEFVIDTAKRAKIPYQLSQIARGGTDAGIIHISNAGCPSVVLGVPTRHIHSHVGICSMKDIENSVKLVVELVKKLDKKTVNDFTKI